MKRLAALALVFSAAGLAAAEPTKSVTLKVLDDTSVNGKVVSAGDYKVSWTEANSEAQVTFAKNGKVVAEAHAKIEERNAASDSDALVSGKDSSGASALLEIRLKGKKSVLVLSHS